MKEWIKVTNPEGTPVYLRLDQMVCARPFVPDIDFTPPAAGKKSPRDSKPDDLSAAKAIIDLTNGVQAVLEPPEKIMEMIEVAQKEADKEAGA